MHGSKNSINWDSGHVTIESVAGSLSGRLIIGYVLDIGGGEERYILDLTIHKKNKACGDGFPESLKCRLCFANWPDSLYWIGNIPYQAIQFLFMKNEFAAKFIDANEKLLKDIGSITDFFVESSAEAGEHFKELKENPAPPEGVDKRKLQ